jgi:hypothetical protein
MERSTDLDVRPTSRGTRRAFRIVAGVLGVLGIALSVPFTVISFFDEAESIHRMHYVASVASYGVLLGAALVAAARRPEREVSAFLVAVASGVAGAIAGLASGDFVSGVWFVAPISIAVLWALHPSRAALARPAGVHVPTAALSLVALVPAVAFLLTQSELQRNGSAGDPHWEFHHYSAMAATALGLALCGLTASLRVPGRVLGAWLVGAAGVVMGAGSLLLSDHAGAFEPAWAWPTLAWSVGIVALTRVPTGSDTGGR